VTYGVGAVLRLAIGLALQRKLDLNQQVIADALEVWRECNEDLKAEGAERIGI
jgi:hypothetical protein